MKNNKTVFGPIKNENFARDFRRDMPALTDRRNGLCFIRNELSSGAPAATLYRYILYYNAAAAAHITAADSRRESTAAASWARADICFSYIFYYFCGRLMAASLAVHLNYSDNGFNYHFHTHRPGTVSLLYDSPKLSPAAEIYCSLK